MLPFELIDFSQGTGFDQWSVIYFASRDVANDIPEEW
jgi:hypothetical protein